MSNPKPGWLKRQLDAAAKEVASWPPYLRAAAKIQEPAMPNPCDVDFFIGLGFHNQGKQGGSTHLCLTPPFPFSRLYADVSDTGAVELTSNNSDLLLANPTREEVTTLVTIIKDNAESSQCRRESPPPRPPST